MSDNIALSWNRAGLEAVRRTRTAGRSRRYGGIHFRDGDLVGHALGAMVGARAWEAASDLFCGRDHRGRPAA